MAPKFTQIARTLRKNDTWAENLLWKWLRDRRFPPTSFGGNILIRRTFWIFSVWRPCSILNWMADNTVLLNNTPKIRRVMSGWRRAESKCCASGTDASGARRKRYGRQSGRLCRNGRLDRCLGIVGRCHPVKSYAVIENGRAIPSPGCSGVESSGAVPLTLTLSLGEREVLYLARGSFTHR